MKAMLRQINDGGRRYEALTFVCPGCVAERPESTGLYTLPVNTKVKETSWKWDGNLLRPTLNPSVLTRTHAGRLHEVYVCHFYLRKGIFEFLNDCTHSLAGQFVDIPDLPDWIAKEKDAR